MYHLFFLFFFLYLLNQLSFLFYNYSWFSLLCSTYIIDFYNLFYFFFTNLDYVGIVMNTLVVHDMFLFYTRWSFFYFLEDFIVFGGFSLFTLSLSFITSVDTVYCLYFDTKVIGNTHVYFYILQNKLFIVPGETTLSFFRIYNENIFPISGITIYSITPFEFQSFVNKIQCFCFEEIVVNSFEIIELPVLFYLDTNVVYLNVIQVTELCIEYVLLCSKVA